MRATRGTSNGNERGSTEDRRRSREWRRRREWLVETYRADEDYPGETVDPARRTRTGWAHGFGMSACRCYRCGVLLTVDTVTVDRIIPGCRGGTYRRSNIRPCCGRCNSGTGGGLRGES